MKQWVFILLIGAVMTTYNTGNAVGSTDPRDLYDNAENMDLLSAGPEMEYPDRLGVPRKSWAGMEQDFDQAQSDRQASYEAWLAAAGFESTHLTYIDGQPLTVERPTQLIDYNGSVYRAKMPASFPVSLSGTWADDAALLTDVGDQALRTELASPAGAGMVSTSATTTVAGDIDDLKTSAAALTQEVAPVAGLSNLSKRQYRNTLTPAVIDMHFGTLAGHGWNPAEVGGNQSTTTTAAVAQNVVDIPVANAGIFAVDQLICFTATDGQLYSAILRSKNGNTIRIDRQLPVSLASGAGVYGFYRDDAHPNIKGAATIVDDAMRQLSSQLLYEVEYRSADGAIWTPVSGATVTSLTATDYFTPGGADVADRAVSVYSATAGAGVQTRPVALVGGDYVTNVVVNPGLRDGGFSGQVDVSIVERMPDGSEFTIAYRGGVLSYSGVRSIELPYSARPGSLISVRITSANAGGFTFYAGAVTHKRVSGYLADINRGKHVLLGDSWFTSGGEFHNALTVKLNKAQVVSKGIPGNRASQLLERFDADVVAEAPDYVWVMVGTNDYYASVSPALFDQQINQLRARILAIGAQPIFFTASVGATAPTAGGGDQLAKSRAYALRVNYATTARAANGAGCASRNATFNAHGISVGANSTVLVGVIPGHTRLNGVVRFAAVSGAGLQLVFDYPSTVDGAGAVDALTVAASTPVKDTAIPRADTNLRYIAVRVKNPTGTAVPTSVVADICWTNSEG
ncbi:hypothetical protein A3710_17150 [Stutzerimonas frequens]|uniref:GDSL-type esterase/lipase family protein n=1 Tax=Stutzerimonas frequens TaxID=2968969 RepID=UPI0007B797BA|nr:GDSL-type esterase/lipase family protein [Stutzerimonas frequens]KZX63175.1 hypothetical protein A3710_17150 [Stutzerimonas frequens]